VTEPIRVFGADWCGDCIRSKRVLERSGARFEWIDVEIQAGAAAEAVELADGRRNIPVIAFPDGRVLVEPSDRELEGALGGSN
jgi:mycoredoxin